MQYGGLLTYTHKPNCWIYSNNNFKGKIKTHDTNDRFSRIKLITQSILNNPINNAGQPPASQGAGSYTYQQWPSIFFGD